MRAVFIAGLLCLCCQGTEPTPAAHGSAPDTSGSAVATDLDGDGVGVGDCGRWCTAKS